jgi:fatty-acyl-CoA synthase
VDARVFDDDDREVPWDGITVGEICARSNHVMDRYWNDPDATAETLRDGWLRTGDLAVVMPDGYMRIVDRKKDMVVSGGENVSTVEVEHAIAEHPAVLEVAVVGIPDERWGEVPKAWVSVRPGQTLTPEEVTAFVRERLAGFKTPKHVTIVDELPHGGTGKISKVELRSRG